MSAVSFAGDSRDWTVMWFEQTFSLAVVFTLVTILAAVAPSSPSTPVTVVYISYNTFVLITLTIKFNYF